MTEENNSNADEQVTPIQETPKKQESIGQYLRRKREEKGYSLKVISQQTKIHISLLESLEADEFEKLPSKTYVKGFIRSTCKILGSEPSEALELLEKAYSNVAPTESVVLKHALGNSPSDSPSSSGINFNQVKSMTATGSIFMAKIATVALVIGVIGYNVKNYVQDLNNQKQEELPEVITSLPKAEVPKPVVAEKTEPTEPVAEEPLKINLIDAKTAKTDVVVNDVSLESFSIGEKQYVDEKLSKEKYDEYLPARFRVDPIDGQESIFINAVDGDSWLTYKVDDKEIKKFVLKQGRTLFLRGKLVRLFIGNAKTIKVFRNNQAINIAHNTKTGVKSVVFPEAMKTKYLAPLFVFLDDGTVITSDEHVQQSQAQKQNVNQPSPASPIQNTQNTESAEAKKL
jgi:cytoskeleton protein RodZ